MILMEIFEKWGGGKSQCKFAFFFDKFPQKIIFPPKNQFFSQFREINPKIMPSFFGGKTDFERKYTLYNIQSTSLIQIDANDLT